MNRRIAQSAWLRITRSLIKVTVRVFLSSTKNARPGRRAQSKKVEVSIQNFQRAPNSTESTS